MRTRMGVPSYVVKICSYSDHNVRRHANVSHSVRHTVFCCHIPHVGGVHVAHEHCHVANHDSHEASPNDQHSTAIQGLGVVGWIHVVSHLFSSESPKTAPASA